MGRIGKAEGRTTMTHGDGKSDGPIVALALVGVGTTMAATALLHHVVGADKLFGVYAPRYMAPPPYMAPLLNPNHLAGLMALLASVALALAFTMSPRYRALSLAAALLMTAVGLLTQSRGGALVLGLGTASVLLGLHRRRGAHAGSKLPLSSAIAMGIVALCALVLVGVLSGGGVGEELLGTTSSELGQHTSKFGAWRSATVLLHDHAWSGVGRGGFEASFPRVHNFGGTGLYSHLDICRAAGASAI